MYARGAESVLLLLKLLLALRGWRCGRGVVGVGLLVFEIARERGGVVVELGPFVYLESGGRGSVGMGDSRGESRRSLQLCPDVPLRATVCACGHEERVPF